jgi:hypothetical protein
MEDEARAFYRKLLGRQGRVKSGNLVAFPIMLDFLNGNYIVTYSGFSIHDGTL